MFSIKEEILNEIDALENFDKKKLMYNKYLSALNNYKEGFKSIEYKKKESKRYQMISISNFHL